MIGAVGFWVAAGAAPTFRTLQLDAGAIETLARSRLGKLLLHAGRRTSFYAKRLQEAGIEWGDPALQREPISVLKLLPPVTKLELRQAGGETLAGGQVRPEWRSSSSSGSTGEPFRVFYDARAWATLKHLVKLRARWACGVRPGDRLALLDAVPPEQGRSGLARSGRFARISVLQPASAVADALTAFAPDAVYGLPSALLEAARALQLRGDALRVRTVFTSGELLDGSTRALLGGAFHAAVYDVYGTSETKEIAWECPEGGMHINADVVHLEVLDEAGRSLPPGMEGDLVATSLINHAMPLLRYRTGDRGALLSGGCSCGRSLPLLGVVTGRASDVLVLQGGRRVSQYALTCALERVSGVLRYQVSQLDPSRVRVRALLEAAADRTVVAAEMRTALRFDVAPFLEADVEFVDRFPTGPRAKFRVVEPLR